MDEIGAYRELVGRLLPEDRPDRLTVHQGQFHQVVMGSRHVVCFPRTAGAAARLPERAARLRALAGLQLGFRTPRPVARAGDPRPGEPAFLLLTRVPGAPLPASALECPEAAEAVARQYAALLAGLAAAGADRRARRALPHNPPYAWREFAAAVRAELFPLMSAEGVGRAERQLAALDALPHRTTAVVHGDLGAENVLWETGAGAPRLSGVVDWDEVSLGDPAEDLAAVGASYGTDLMERILAHRDRPDAAIRDRIAAVRGTFALQQALSAHRDGDAEELADGLRGYR
ncbi:phosphotransferase [Streptomyces albus subsp. albus]|nr:phosphotransferase [Streptomyces albus subsp. albus]